MSRTVEFNKEEIIDKAMQVFWSKGFEKTSMSDLVQATGLLKGSLYNTFESKENLFLLCLEKYGQNSRSLHFSEGDPSEYLMNFYRKLVSDGSDKSFTRGCLVMNSCMELAGSNTLSEKKTKSLFAATERNLKNAVDAIVKKSKSSGEKEKVKIALLTAAFSIRELSKFRKEKVFLKQIANNALKELSLSI